MAQHPNRSSSLLLSALLLVVACGDPPQPEPEEPAAQAVVAESAGIRIAAVPQLFSVDVNDAERFELTVPSLPGSRIVVTLGDEQEGGLNIVETVKQELAAFTARPGGQSFGQTQLMAPIGLTYMVRGRYVDEETTREELRALVVHPWGNRLLTVAYSYPVGEDTSDRGGQLMELLGEIEALEDAAAGAEAEADA